MRGYEAVLLEAELMAMSPEMVATFLKNRAVQLHDSAYKDKDVDKGVEEALRQRADPLINLALARYARHIEVIKELFQSSDPGSPIRLGCLANRSVATLLSNLPEALLGWGRVSNWFFYTASDGEIRALLKNPTLNDSFLINLLERRGDFKDISDEMLLTYVSILCSNPRFRSPMEGDYIEVLSEWPDNGAINAVWRLAEAAPVTKFWAMSLGFLYDKLRPSYSIADPLTLAQRWCLDSADLEAPGEGAHRSIVGRLSSTQQVRKCLAKLALIRSAENLSELMSSDDVAVRCAAYSSGSLNAEQVLYGFERDGDLGYYELLSNDLIWQNPDAQLMLREIIWRPELWGIQIIYASDAFELREKHIRDKHPEWLVEKKSELKTMAN
jgi:hypothetical protein